MVAAVLLEFENVLAVTGDARREALRRALADDGLALEPARYDDCCAGRPVRDAVAAAVAAAGAATTLAATTRAARLDDTAIDLAALRAERYFAEQVGKGVTLAPGAREFVEHAHGRARLGLVTRASRREVEFVLGLAGLAAAFECVVCADDVAAGKPDPGGHRLALSRLSRKRAVPPAQALALEDTLPGIRAARAAGTRVAAVGGLPAYCAVAADAYIQGLRGHTLDSLARLVTHGPERVNHE